MAGIGMEGFFKRSIEFMIFCMGTLHVPIGLEEMGG